MQEGCCGRPLSAECVPTGRSQKPASHPRKKKPVSHPRGWGTTFQPRMSPNNSNSFRKLDFLLKALQINSNGHHQITKTAVSQKWGEGKRSDYQVSMSINPTCNFPKRVFRMQNCAQRDLYTRGSFESIFYCGSNLPSFHVPPCFSDIYCIFPIFSPEV